MKRPNHITTQWKALTMSIVLHLLIVIYLLLPINTFRETINDSETTLDSLPPIEQILIDLEILQSTLPANTPTTSANTPSESASTPITSGTPSTIATHQLAAIPAEDILYSDTLLHTQSADSTYAPPPLRATIIERSVATIQQYQPQPKEIALYDNPVIQATLDSAISALKESIAHHPTPRQVPSTDRERELQSERYNFYRTNYRTIYNLLKVYPYAIMVRDITQRVDSQLAQMTSDRERRAFIRTTEKELFNQFEAIVKKMSYSQGKILLKLIARETGNSTYEIIKNYKGTFSASFWYSIGRLFTANLKEEYDKEGDDQVIEEILQRSENGEYMLFDRGVYLY